MTLQEAMKVMKPQGNSAEDLTAAYRLLAKKYHPDINPDGEQIMKAVNAAVAMLREHLNKWSIRSFVDDGAPSIDEELAAIYAKIRRRRESIPRFGRGAEKRPVAPAGRGGAILPHLEGL